MEFIRKEAKSETFPSPQTGPSQVARPGGAKTMEAVGGSGRDRIWAKLGRYPSFMPKLKCLLKARPEGGGGKTEVPPTTLQDTSVQGLPKAHILWG